jgi:hypothetical protein
LAEDYKSMSVNERLFAAGLMDAYDEAVASQDLRAVNAVLRRVGLRQDEAKMNWTITDNADD